MSGRALGHRRSIRLRHHDYTTATGYFLTLVTRNRARIFASGTTDGIQLSALGHAVERCWLAIPDHFPSARTDAYAIMPEHFHGIVFLPTDSPRPVPLSSVVRGFKIGVTLWARAHLKPGRIWHRNYYERIVRDERALAAIRRYIIANPAKWSLTHRHPR